MKHMPLNELAAFEEKEFTSWSLDVLRLTCGGFGVDEILGVEPENYFYFKGDIKLPEDTIVEMPSNHDLYVIDGSIRCAGTLCFHAKTLANLLVVIDSLEAENLELQYCAFVIINNDVNIVNHIENSLGDPGGFYVNGNFTYKTIKGTNNPVRHKGQMISHELGIR